MKSFWILILLTLVFLSLGQGVGVAEMSDRQQYNAGLVAMKNGNFREALQNFTKAAEMNPNEFKYYNDRGVAHKRLGDLEKALADYNKSLEINPHYTNALNNRGVIHLEQGRYDEALADFQEALKYGGLEGKIFTNIGIAKAAKGDHSSAIKDFDNAVSLHPVDPRSFLFMGQSLEHLGNNDKALKMYQVALGVIKEPEIIAMVEKKIAALDQSSGSLLPLPHRQSNNQSEKSSKATVSPSVKSTTTPAKQTREIVLANRRPDYVEQLVKQNTQKPIQTDLPEGLAAFNKQIRDKTISQLAPASAEILRQATDFVEKSDDYTAMIRFEDIRQLEKRNKNYRAVGWALLETGRIYIRRGDYLKAEESIDNSLKIFSALKTSDEKILTLIELARLKKFEMSTDKAKGLFAQALDLASALGRPTLTQGIQDLADGSFDQRKNSPIQGVTQAKSPPQNGVSKEEVSATKAGPRQQENYKASETTARFSTPHSPQVSLDQVKSVFDKKPENSQTKKTAGQSGVSVSANIDSPDSKNYRLLQRAQKPEEKENGVATPTASVHPDAMKPAVNSQKSRGIVQAPSKKDAKRSIDQDLVEIKKLRMQNDETKMIPVLENLSKNYSEAGDYEKALNAINVALAFREKLGVNDGRARSLELRGLIHEKLGRNVEALEDLTWAGSLSKYSNETNGTKAKNLARNLGLDVDAALKDYRNLWLARESGDRQSEIKSLLELGKLFAKIENFQEASKCYELLNASLMAQRSIFYQKLGKLDEARKTMEQALQTLKSLDYLLYFSFMNRSDRQDKLSAVRR